MCSLWRLFATPLPHLVILILHRPSSIVHRILAPPSKPLLSPSHVSGCSARWYHTEATLSAPGVAQRKTSGGWRVLLHAGCAPCTPLALRGDRREKQERVMQGTDVQSAGGQPSGNGSTPHTRRAPAELLRVEGV